MEQQLTDNNFIEFAMKHYDRPNCTIEQFNEDLYKFKILQRCFSSYKNDGNINEHLILNHIITLYNLFGDAATKMLLFKIKKESWYILRPFLILINRDTPKLEDVCPDDLIITKLRSL